jgi:ATP-dependent DNA helicase Rep
MVGLNEAQARAVEHFQGPALVLAGAGSGKTRVITQRIVRLLSRGVAPNQIVALTFTNKAAKEMAERVTHLLADRRALASKLMVSTFHSFGLAVLSREARVLSGAFTIFDQGDQLALVKEILASIRVAKSLDASAILARISAAKNAGLTEETFVPREEDLYDEVTRLVLPKYTSRLRAYGAYDFDDLVCEVTRVLETRPDIRGRWQARARFLLVDEYQDTNRAQIALLRALMNDEQNICAVGDDDQSIYAWRGADVRNILGFDRDFAGANIIKLEQNYRSRKPILDVANTIIGARKEEKFRKVLFTTKAAGEPVRLGLAASPEAEAKYVGSRVRELTRDQGVKPSEIAILYRSNSQAKLIEEILREHGVGYTLVGGQQFFERKEVKDVLAYMKLALNRSDEISLRRVINTPTRGVGETSLERLALQARAKGWTLWQAIERVDALDGVSPAAREGCKKFESCMATLRRRLLVERTPPSRAARLLCDEIGLKQEVTSSSGSGAVAERRWANVESLFTTFERREKAGAISTERELASFLHMLTLNADSDEVEPGNLVTLSTLHGSKGLEFEHVFFIGVEEGIIPHTRTTETKATDLPLPEGVDPIEEERRLFYVGVTRAKERLIMTRCGYRVARGKAMPRVATRFLLDVPEGMIEEFTIHEAQANIGDMAAGAEAFLAAIGGGDS